MKIFLRLFFSYSLLFSQNLFSQNLVINEIITSNSNVVTDDDGSYEDWVELYNASNESVNLLGYGLSDNSNYFKWEFPEYYIQPNEHLLVWCSNKNRINPSLPLHTNFAISSGGETITLTQPDGTIVDQIPAIVIPSNYSYGRQTDGSNAFVIFPQPTPGNSNTTEGFSEILNPPVFSVNSGFYQDEFNLSITSIDPDVTIIYTLDGSEPDENNLLGTTYQYKNQYPYFPEDNFGILLEENFTSYTYNGQIEISDRTSQPNKLASISTTTNTIPYYIPNEPIFKGTVIRAKAIKAGAMASNVVTHNYFISNEGTNRFSLPVVAISLDEDLLFDYQNGIHVAGVDYDNWRTQNPTQTALFADANYKRSGDQWEVKGNFSFFNNSQEILNQDIGIRIHGGFTRSHPQKSLRLYARGEFGESNFSHSFFNDPNYNSYKRLILRNSGNDAYSTYFRDAFIQKAVAHLNIDTQDYQPVITFVNGEFWGILNMRERYDKHYFKRVYNVDEEDLDFLEYNGYLIQEGSYDHYINMYSFIQNNSLQNSANYNYIETQMDYENFTDHFIANIYARNTDWPHNNIEFWRKKTTQYEPNAPYGQDGRWRWVLKDTDFGFGADGGTEAYLHNTLAFATSIGGDEITNPEWSTLIFRKLLENSTFKTNFINRFADLMNTTYLPERLITIIDEMKSKIEGEILEHGHRWSSFNSLDQWSSNINVMKNFAQNRTEQQRNHIREKFNIEENITATFDVSDEAHGFIKINTININPETPGINENPYPWNGIYFKNIPITIKAIAKPGFKFSHWSGNSISPEEEITISPNGDIQLTAHFIPTDESAEEIPLYFWMLDSTVANDTPLTQINASFEIPSEGTLTYQSSLEGYPFTSSHANWRKASMERRNSPTDINYIPEANNNIPFSSANMRGIQIKQPFQNNGLENQMIFNFSTEGYENIVFGFTAKDENAADAILVEYSTTANEPTWTTTDLDNSVLTLTNDYQLFEIDFSSIATANDNPNFKVRLRFDGSNMTADNGDRVTFNNFSVKGNAYLKVKEEKPLQFTIYPNPATNEFYVVHQYDSVEYVLYSIDGKVVKQGILPSYSINIEDIQKGIYLLKLTSNNKSLVKKIIKR
jgi:hypothetical protein